MWKSLEFDRRKCGLSYEKAQTEKRERKGDWSHGPFLLFIDPRGSERLHQPTGEPPGARQRLAPQRIAARRKRRPWEKLYHSRREFSLASADLPRARSSRRKTQLCRQNKWSQEEIGIASSRSLSSSRAFARPVGSSQWRV